MKANKTGQHVGYIRVSSVDQETARQLAGIELDKTYTDKASGSTTDKRKALAECLAYLRDGDTLHVHSIDRLARNLADLQNIVADLTRRGVTVRFEKECLTFSATADDAMQIAMQTLMLQMLGAFAQFERAMIRERQREGIAAARAAGKHCGRPSALTSEQLASARARKAQGESVAAIAKDMGVSRATMYLNLKDQDDLQGEA